MKHLNRSALKLALFAMTIAFILSPAAGQNPTLVNAGPDYENRMAWWKDARFGLFISWGLYSIPAGVWKGETARKDYAEWVMHNFEIPFEEYRQLANDFNPTKFDPDSWAELAKQAGMGYFVFTTKHHDGFAMFDSDVSDYNIIDATPFDRDIFGELANAFRERGMRAGAYYSQDLDWSQPQGSTISSYNTWDYPVEENDYEIFDKYLHGKSLPQIEELATNYGDVNVFWFDFPRMVRRKRGKLVQDVVRKYQPDAIISGRICNPQGLYADYLVPGDNGYFTSPQPAAWECCATMDESWGYKRNAHTERSADELIVQLATTVSAGGNLLLNIGPKPDGTIPQRQIDILEEIGVWMKDNAEAIHGNRANPFGEFYPWGVLTVRDGDVYLHVTEWDAGKIVRLERLKNEVSQVELLGDPDRKLKWLKKGDLLKIALDGDAVHSSASVIKVSTPDSTVQVEPVRIAESNGKIFLPTRYAMSYASRMHTMHHYRKEGEVVVDISRGHPSEHIVWDFEVKRPGALEAVADFYRPSERDFGPREVILTDDSGNEMSVMVSKDSLEDDKMLLGEIEIAESGPAQLTLKVDNGDRTPLYLESITLQRVR